MSGQPADLAALALDDRPLALFLNVDGTLIEIAHRPSDLVVSPGLRRTLTTVFDSVDGAMALVSGRTLGELDRLFAPLKLPTAGQHGLELRDARGTVIREINEINRLGDMEDALRVFAMEAPGTILAHRGMSLALYYGDAPQFEEAARQLARNLVARYSENFHFSESVMELEIIPRGASKDIVVDSFMAAPPFAGRRPLYAGDDRSDEDGFAAVHRLGGISVQVGARIVTTIAQYRARSIADFHDWLARLPARVERHSPLHQQ